MGRRGDFYQSSFIVVSSSPLESIKRLHSETASLARLALFRNFSSSDPFSLSLDIIQVDYEDFHVSTHIGMLCAPLIFTTATQIHLAS